MPVGDDGNPAFLAGKGCNRIAKRTDTGLKRQRIGIGIVEDRCVEHFEAAERCFRLFAQLQHVEMGEDRRGHDDLPCRLCADIRLGAERDSERHAVGFADAVERRVGHLGKTLGEIFRDAAFLIGKRVDGIAITHGGDLFRAGLKHRVHQELEAFLIVGIGDVTLVALQIAIITQRRALCFRRNFRQV
ncbi:hypothetical protein D3C73_678840 [compost metagenome]